MDLFNIRKDYRKGHLSPEDLLSDPILQIQKWISDAEQAKCLEHSSVVLSTLSGTGGVSSRVVLLKQIDEVGLYVFTNYDSRKGQQIAEYDKGAMLFFWPELERQINVEGTIEKCSDELSDEYFNMRPLASRVSAVASQQSACVASRAELDAVWQTVNNKAKAEGISRPDYWGGYVLKPTRVEFWQGGSHRFHDRILFELFEGVWKISRLMP